jgi:uncharacterized membrane protein
MLERVKSFVKTSLLGGVVVILPVVIVFLAFRWLVSVITRVIAPLTRLVTEASRLQSFLAGILTVTLIVLVCFLVGAVLKTRAGIFFYQELENRILRIAPGYSLAKQIVIQFLGQKERPFSRVALVRVFGNETLMTAFVTGVHPDGMYTVFVPSGLNPTTGTIFHLPCEFVHPVDVSVEEAMKSIISCGSGSSALIRAYLGKRPETLDDHPEKI